MCKSIHPTSLTARVELWKYRWASPLSSLMSSLCRCRLCADVFVQMSSLCRCSPWCRLCADVRLGLPGHGPHLHLHLRPRHLPRVPEGGGDWPAAALPGGCPCHGSCRSVKSTVFSDVTLVFVDYKTNWTIWTEERRKTSSLPLQGFFFYFIISI